VLNMALNTIKQTSSIVDISYKNVWRYQRFSRNSKEKQHNNQ
jgi:hypothetical protein